MSQANLFKNKNMNKNQLYLEKSHKMLLNDANTWGKIDNIAYAVTISKNFETLGFVLSDKMLNALRNFTIPSLERFYKDTVPVLKKMVGAHVRHRPMYANFPQQVMDMSKSELYFNAIVHYFTLWMPSYPEEIRPPLFDNPKLKIIDLGDENDFRSIFTNLVSSKTSISPSDKEIVSWFIKDYLKDDLVDLLPETIPLKENVGFIVGEAIKHTNIPLNVFGKYFKTATDILRFAVVLSDGDVSLAKNTKFISFPRKIRKGLLNLLDSIRYENALEDMARYPNVWIRLGERIHPGQFKQYPNAFRLFKAIRNEKVKTFNSKLEEIVITSFASKVSKDSLATLKSRPGDFARRLDTLLRNATPHGRTSLINGFLDIADKVSTPVLLQVMTHFRNRFNNQNEKRVFFPKGNVANMKTIDDDRSAFPSKIALTIASGIADVLTMRFASLPSLGNVYVDENLSNYLVPFSQRSASKALKTLVRGSKIPLDATNTLRFFIWWKNMGSGYDGRVDIDLSAVTLDENWNYLDTLSYYSLKTVGGCHSGDITNAPDGASEFIDINIDKTIQSGARYVAMVINSYTQQAYKDLPECFAGWMNRESANSGEIFEAKTVENKIDVTADSKIVVPMIFDLIDKKVIWCDLALKNNNWYANNVHSNKTSIIDMCRAMTNLKKPNLYDLFELHAKARGKLVANVEKADTVFAEHVGITPLQTDEITNKYL